MSLPVLYPPHSSRKKKKTDAYKVIKAAVDAREATPPSTKPITVAEKTAAELKFLEVQRKRVRTLISVLSCLEGKKNHFMDLTRFHNLTMFLARGKGVEIGHEITQGEGCRK